MTASQRIAFNTLATYGRSVLGMFLGLFSSRWVLQALGQQDYGLYAVVGSVIVFITFLNGVTSGSVARFLAFSIGKGGSEETVRWFSTLCVAFRRCGSVSFPKAANVPNGSLKMRRFGKVSMSTAVLSEPVLPFTLNAVRE
jgi:hypothetical protein